MRNPGWNIPESFLEDIQRWHRDLLEIAFGFLEAHEENCESPIEALFVIAFEAMAGAERLRFSLKSQAEIAGFRVDFLITMKENTCIVECDGRDFHHTTWDQIDRDRKRDQTIEAATGYKIFRFPGTQICNQPTECVCDVIDYLRSDANHKAEAAE